MLPANRKSRVFELHSPLSRQGDFNRTASGLADSALEDIRKRSLQGLDVLERYDMLLSEIREAFHDHKRSLPKRATARSVEAAEELRRLHRQFPDPECWSEHVGDFDAALLAVRDSIEDEAEVAADDHRISVTERDREDTNLSKRAKRRAPPPHFTAMMPCRVAKPADWTAPAPSSSRTASPRSRR